MTASSPFCMAKRSMRRTVLVLSFLVITAVVVVAAQSFMSTEDIPLPFGYTSTAHLQGQVTQVGVKSGIAVKKVTFPVGTDSELLAMDSLYLVVIPDEETLRTVPLDLALTLAGVRSVNYFGYIYTTPDATEEKAHQGDPILTVAFPGQFFVSAKARAEDVAHGNAIAQFEADNGITMSLTDGTTGTAMLTPNSLYFIVVNESTPALFTARLSALCGNDWVDQGGVDGIAGNADDEECDDGNTAYGDGCSNICQIEEGYVCSGNPSQCEFLCGNGSIEFAGADNHIGNADDEQCDDANRVTGDGCNNTCQREAGYVCNGTPSQCEALCGNGNTDFVGADERPGTADDEQCDDGDYQNGDGCSACQIDQGYICNNSAQPSQCEALCGNGYTDQNGADELPGTADDEECDDGDYQNGDGCSACQIDQGYICNTGTQPSTCASDSPVCGDNICHSSERSNEIQCPPSSSSPYPGMGMCPNPAYCPGDCAVCGNFIREGSEQCDDGNQSNTDNCTNICRNRACGDTFVQSSEQCDDGNMTAGDGCSGSCTIENTNLCGNGQFDDNGIEQCDDGNTIETDDCNNACQLTTPTPDLSVFFQHLPHSVS